MSNLLKFKALLNHSNSYKVWYGSTILKHKCEIDDQRLPSDIIHGSRILYFCNNQVAKARLKDTIKNCSANAKDIYDLCLLIL